MPSLTSLVNTRVGGQDSLLELDDANGVQYAIEADSTTGQLVVRRGGVIVGGFAAGGGTAYVAPTAATASTTLAAADSGKLYTTTGASGAVVFTLPSVATAGAGFNAMFYNTVGQNMTITAPAGTLVAFNNAAATSVAFSTAGQLIGGGMRIFFDGAKYIASNASAGANTVTVA